MKVVLIALTMSVLGMEAVAQTPGSQGRSERETLAAIAPNFTDGYAQALKKHRFIIGFRPEPSMLYLMYLVCSWPLRKKGQRNHMNREGK